MEKKQELKAVKQELVKKEYQDNMKEYLENRKQELVEKLAELRGNLSTVELKSLLSIKNTIGASPKYSNTELAFLFDYYKQFIEEINKKHKLIPTIPGFCGFIGISSNQYNAWREVDDEERRNIVNMIDDYIADLQLTSAQKGEQKEITTMFRMKTENKMVEAQAPVVIEHKSNVDVDKMIAQIQAVKQGKSLQTIELRKQEDGSFGIEE